MATPEQLLAEDLLLADAAEVEDEKNEVITISDTQSNLEPQDLLLPYDELDENDKVNNVADVTMVEPIQSSPVKKPNFTGSQEPIECYIHCVSPMRISGTTTYFNYDIQTNADVRKGVCFATEKKEAIDTISKQHSPVKISKYTLSKKYGRDDVVINKKTIITPIPPTFAYKDIENITSISALAQVAPDQLVAIKGYLSQISNTKTIVLRGNPVKKQEGYIVDPTGNIKIVLWGTHTDTIAECSTYYFDKVRVKVSNQERYLNTPKCEEECTIKMVAPFDEQLSSLPEKVSAVVELTANIVGVTDVMKYYSCFSCSKKVTTKGKVAFCNTCKMTLKLSSCSVQWFLKLLVEDPGKPDHKKRLLVYNDMVYKIASICGFDLLQAEENEMVEGILDFDLVMLSYDTQNNKLVAIDKLEI